MTSYIRDVFQIKRLEKKVGRKLSTAELEGEFPVRYKDSNGRIVQEYVKKFNAKDFYGK